MSYIEFIKNQVDLNAYSLSRGFLGYCYLKDGTCDDASCIDHCIAMLDEIFTDAIVVSSLRIYGALKAYYEEYDLNSNEQQLVGRLIDSGIVLNVSIDELDDTFHFVGNVSRCVMRDFITFQLMVGGLSYHAFITNSDKEVIIYPHDDSGIGFIANNKQSRTPSLINFLKGCVTNYSDIFEFHLEIRFE